MRPTIPLYRLGPRRAYQRPVNRKRWLVVWTQINRFNRVVRQLPKWGRAKTCVTQNQRGAVRRGKEKANADAKSGCGARYRMLNVLDEFTHECLAIRVAR